MTSGLSPPLPLASGNKPTQDISNDELQLRAQGHVQELPRQFSTFSILSLSFSITNSWIGYSAVFVTPLYSGGGPGVIYCLLAASVACSLITAGLAELASAFPSAGGQYQSVKLAFTLNWPDSYLHIEANIWVVLASHTWSLALHGVLQWHLSLAG